MDYLSTYTDLYARGYHQNPEQHHALEKLIPWMVSNLDFTTFLELGASRGAAVRRLRTLGKEGIGLDIVDTGVPSDVLQGNAASLPHAPSSFDLVWSSDFMEHLAPEHLADAIEHQIRVSRKWIVHRICTRPSSWKDAQGNQLHLSLMDRLGWVHAFTRTRRLALYTAFAEKPSIEVVVFQKVETPSQSRGSDRDDARSREKSRSLECQYRRGGCCDLINATLGWKHGCPLADCDKCWAAGPTTDVALTIRGALASSYLAAAKRNLAFAPKEVLKVMVRDHLTPDEVVVLQKDPEYQWAFTREERWAKVRHTWEQAESWTKAMSSRGFTGRRVDLTVKGERTLSCFGLDPQGNQVKPPCRALRTSRDGIHHYCGECGCGDREAAFLDGAPYAKLDYPYLECPRQMPGFSQSGPQ